MWGIVITEKLDALNKKCEYINEHSHHANEGHSQMSPKQTTNCHGRWKQKSDLQSNGVTAP